VKQRLTENADKTVEFIDKINTQQIQSGDPELEAPLIDNMSGCLVEVQETAEHKIYTAQRQL
jgi:hypothetical protein